MARADGEAWCAEHHVPSRALSWAGVLIGALAFSYPERQPRLARGPSSAGLPNKSTNSSLASIFALR
jgi:hypothetical protein